MKTAIVTGEGVAGLTIAYLLRRHGWRVTLGPARARGAPAARGPMLVLRDATMHLLCDVWGLDLDALPDRHRLVTRIVQTNGIDRSARPQVLPDTGWTIAVGALQDRLREVVFDAGITRHAAAIDREYREDRKRDDREVREDRDDRVDIEAWQIDASGRAATAGAGSWSGGRRMIVAAHAELHAATANDGWSFESIPDGWLLVAPLAARRAMVQLMTPVPRDESDSADAPDGRARVLDRALSNSRLARAMVSRLDSHCGTWSAAPAFVDPWPAPRALRVGDATMAFDPICGDGTGHAIRGAVLATAALNAIEDDRSSHRNRNNRNSRSNSGDAFASSIRDHYRQRLRLAFLDHLRTCLELYSSFTPAEPWVEDLRHMTAAHDALQDGAPTADTFRYRLVDSRLLPMPARRHAVASSVMAPRGRDVPRTDG